MPEQSRPINLFAKYWNAFRECPPADLHVFALSAEHEMEEINPGCGPLPMSLADAARLGALHTITRVCQALIQERMELLMSGDSAEIPRYEDLSAEQQKKAHGALSLLEAEAHQEFARALRDVLDAPDVLEHGNPGALYATAAKNLGFQNMEAVDEGKRRAEALRLYLRRQQGEGFFWPVDGRRTLDASLVEELKRWLDGLLSDSAGEDSLGDVDQHPAGLT